MILINISNCPISGMARKVSYKALQHNVDSSEIIITTNVQYVVNNEQLNAKGISPYEVKLKADNSTKVNPANGEFVDETFNGAIGQYDFIIGAMQAGTNPFAMIQTNMELADTLGRYN